MNLKEAFRLQNKLQSLMDEAQDILSQDQNITRIQTTLLRKKVMPEADNETILETPSTEYADHITELTDFLLHLLTQRELLARAIRRAKDSLPIDMDSEVGLNSRRQAAAAVLRHMSTLKNSELVIPNGGTGYKFNAEGNQVSYRCDLKRVSTIHYDRKRIRSHLNALSQQADRVSAELDRCLVMTPVDYTADFDVNDSFSDIFEGFLAQMGEVG